MEPRPRENARDIESEKYINNPNYSEYLFVNFEPNISGYIRKCELINYEIEDLIQEISISAWRSAKYFDPHKGNINNWLFFIYRNIIIDKFRRHDVRVRSLSKIRHHPCEKTPETPLEALQRNELRRLIRSALDKLPPSQSEVVSLSFYEDLSHSQISDRLQLPLGTVKTRLRLALSKMQDMLLAAGED